MNQHLDNFLKQLQSDFESNANGDLKIVTRNGLEFNASKYILCLRSPVFAAMFQNDMMESQTNVIKIDQFEPEMMKKFMLYLYTATIENLDEIAVEMFKIADYYDVKLLRAECIEKMIQNLKTSNMIEYLKLADKFFISELKQKAIELIRQTIDISTLHIYYGFAKEFTMPRVQSIVTNFIQHNFLKVSKTEEWKKFSTNFKLNMFQEFFETYPTLQVKKVKSNTNIGNIPDGWKQKSYTLENTGANHAFFIIDTGQKNYAGFYEGPKNGIIAPHAYITFTITYKPMYSYSLFVKYGLYRMERGKKNFDKNELIRQLEINLKTSYPKEMAEQTEPSRKRARFV